LDERTQMDTDYFGGCLFDFNYMGEGSYGIA
jgi:hypothetical protein